MRLSVLQRNQYEQSVCGIAAAGHTIGIFRWFTGLKYDYDSLLSPKSSCPVCVYLSMVSPTIAFRWNIAHRLRRYSPIFARYRFRLDHGSPRAHWSATRVPSGHGKRRGTWNRLSRNSSTPLHRGRTLCESSDRALSLGPSFDFLRIFFVRPFVRFMVQGSRVFTTSSLPSTDYLFSLVRPSISLSACSALWIPVLRTREKYRESRYATGYGQRVFTFTQTS